jgi:radical SAM superfamily enzyme YgiQ (UPF0313 family)
MDANIEGLLYLMHQPQIASDTWTRRSIRNLSGNIATLQDTETYQSHDRYARAVRDLNRVLAVSARDYESIPWLADYKHQRLSPVRSADLIRAAEHPEKNPFYPYFRKRLPEVVEKGQTHMLGISLNFLSQALCAFSMIGYIRKEFPGLKVILGGGLVSSWMKKPDWRNPFGGLVDQLIAGPGERPLLDLLGIEDAGERQSMPDYGSLPLNDYLAPGFILPYSGSSGCYWGKCSFCPEKAEDNPYMPVPVTKAIADLNTLVTKTRPILLHMLDNAISPALMRGLAENYCDAPWYGFARISRDLAGIDFCMALKRSGCVMLQVGLESGDQEVLNEMDKGIDIGTASQVLKNLKKAGIAAYVYLLFGVPAETVSSARRTLDFVIKHREEINFLNLAIFNMPVCSSEAGDYETEQFYDGDLSLYTGFRHPQGWDRKPVRQFLEREFKRHSAVASILRNDPPVFTSNHAAFFKRPRNDGLAKN